MGEVMRVVTSMILGGAAVLMFSVPMASAAGWRRTSRPYTESDSAPAVPSMAKKNQRHELVRPCLGRGYVAYSYPAFDSCPCAGNDCFHPGRYYCGGKPYRKQWFRKWLRAHVGRGSMLDDYACECRFPTVGRVYRRPAPSAPNGPGVPPVPAPVASPAR